ncbi:hypothetical protein PSHT_06584 [Puccinia striiformis]|uniref:Uncharacterized protein n=1 Tax=Puccinia striiformis TaxID=27350 RepID=A0A2S4W596_9BASI|nr:hypothetical protein PSHT_06584 [Puccinia striiformis]
MRHRKKSCLAISNSLIQLVWPRWHRAGLSDAASDLPPVFLSHHKEYHRGLSDAASNKLVRRHVRQLGQTGFYNMASDGRVRCCIGKPCMILRRTSPTDRLFSAVKPADLLSPRPCDKQSATTARRSRLSIRKPVRRASRTSRISEEHRFAASLVTHSFLNTCVQLPAAYKAQSPKLLHLAMRCFTFTAALIASAFVSAVSAMNVFTDGKDIKPALPEEGLSTVMTEPTGTGDVDKLCTWCKVHGKPCQFCGMK